MGGTRGKDSRRLSGGRKSAAPAAGMGRAAGGGQCKGGGGRDDKGGGRHGKGSGRRDEALRRLARTRRALPLRGCGVSRPELTAEGNRRGQNRLHSVDSAALATSRPEAFLGSAWPAARMLHCLQEKIMNRGDFVQPLCKPDTHPSSTRPKLIVRRNRRPPSPKTAKSPPASPVALLAVHHKAGVIQADHGR